VTILRIRASDSSAIFRPDLRPGWVLACAAAPPLRLAFSPTTACAADGSSCSAVLPAKPTCVCPASLPAFPSIPARACARVRISGSAFLPNHSGFRLKGRPFSLTFLPDCRLPGCLPPLALPLVFSLALAFDSAVGPSVRFVRPTRPTVASPVLPSDQTVAFALIQLSGYYLRSFQPAFYAVIS